MRRQRKIIERLLKLPAANSGLNFQLAPYLPQSVASVADILSTLLLRISVANSVYIDGFMHELNFDCTDVVPKYSIKYAVHPYASPRLPA